jgi:hypothetical protein
MSRRSSISGEELEERRKQADQYDEARRKARIDDDIRAIRTAVSYLRAKEKELQEESASLQPFLPHRDESEEA